jgi:hypothetical protein
MLNQDQIELIRREFEGTNTPEGSAAFRSLMERDPPLHLRQAILDALPQPARAAPRIEPGLMTQLRLFTERMEEVIMTRKTMLIRHGAGDALVVVSRVVNPPWVAAARSAGDGIAGSQAARPRAAPRRPTSLRIRRSRAVQGHDMQTGRSGVYAVMKRRHARSWPTPTARSGSRPIARSESRPQIMESGAYRELMEANIPLGAGPGALRSAQDREALRCCRTTRALGAAEQHDLPLAAEQRSLPDAGPGVQALQNNAAFRRRRTTQRSAAADNGRSMPNNEAFAPVLAFGSVKPS